MKIYLCVFEEDRGRLCCGKSGNGRPQRKPARQVQRRNGVPEPRNSCDPGGKAGRMDAGRGAGDLPAHGRRYRPYARAYARRCAGADAGAARRRSRHAEGRV